MMDCFYIWLESSLEGGLSKAHPPSRQIDLGSRSGPRLKFSVKVFLITFDPFEGLLSYLVGMMTRRRTFKNTPTHLSVLTLGQGHSPG